MPPKTVRLCSLLCTACSLKILTYAADGGLYAEKIKNRSFEFPKCPYRLDTFRKVSVAESGGKPFERNPRYVTPCAGAAQQQAYGLAERRILRRFVQERRGVPFFSLRTPRPKSGNDTRGTRRSGVKRRVDGCGISQNQCRQGRLEQIHSQPCAR